MKISMLMLFLSVVTLSSKAQNEPELIQDFTSGQNYFFALIDHDLPKIYLQYSDHFELYNLDFTLFKSIDHPEVLGNAYYIHYITRSMFDCDTTQVEYLANVDSTDPLVRGVRIYREDGSELLNVPNFRLTNIGIGNQDPTLSSVTADGSGSYLMFGQSTPGFDRKLYHFCGQPPQLSARNMQGEILGGRPGVATQGFGLYPNPAHDHIRIEYDLEGYQSATVSIYSISGTLVKQVMVGQAFKSFLLDISSIPAGTYVVHVATKEGLKLSEKFIKI